VHTAGAAVNKEQYAGAARHHKYIVSAAYRKKCSIRAVAESLVNEIANAHRGHANPGISLRIGRGFN